MFKKYRPKRKPIPKTGQRRWGHVRHHCEWCTANRTYSSTKAEIEAAYQMDERAPMRTGRAIGNKKKYEHDARY